ncbi:hypothetical protein HK097_003252 [Rhizophlyctis rosea]|uniref:Tetraspanin n=1 Tax=Rhizophlyctis rosea TaxID=64517 RepID=A0AAD5SFZ5_9FUNG|nr:hypothetical protein HK097_003252 [Rhizophlyctis rosea]
MAIAQILGRIWLILVNFVILAIGAACITFGALWWKAFDLEDSTSEFLWVHYDWRLLAGLLMGVGGYLSITALTGCVGGCTRSRGALNCYIATLVIALLLVIGGGAYGTYKVHREVNNWNDVTAAQWSATSSHDKDLIQFMFNCCGWRSYEDAYTGPHLIFGNATEIPNACADRTSVQAQAPYCQEKGYDSVVSTRKWSSISVAVTAVVLIVSIFASVVSRRRENPAAKGFAPVQEPLMHKA